MNEITKGSNEMTNGSGENHEENDRNKNYTWKDIFAFIIAMYRLLLPQLLITLMVVIVLLYLLFWLWLD